MNLILIIGVSFAFLSQFFTGGYEDKPGQKNKNVNAVISQHKLDSGCTIRSISTHYKTGLALYWQSRFFNSNLDKIVAEVPRKLKSQLYLINSTIVYFHSSVCVSIVLYFPKELLLEVHSSLYQKQKRHLPNDPNNQMTYVAFSPCFVKK